MKNYGKIAFEKAFKKAVPNFDETKVFFSHPSRSYEQSTLAIVVDGKLKKMKMYRSDYYINLWKQHFIEFFEAGCFDYNGYWKLYSGMGGETPTFVNDLVFKIPLCSRFGNDFYEHSDAINRLYETEYGRTIGKEHGLCLVPKNTTGNIIDFNS